MPDWRDEVCSALDFCIGAEGGAGQSERLVCVGPARQESRRGWYSVDLRNSSIGADQIESLRVSGKAGPRGGPSYPVLEAAQVGPVVRVRVAEFVNLVDAHLWQNKQSAAYLLVKLREGIAELADAGLAHDLAAGRLASAPKVVRSVAGFTDQQQEAYESCLSAGVRLVWGPPGTGKTRVLTEAIARLVATGRRVLLVSATNIAVDNALLGAIRSRPEAAIPGLAEAAAQASAALQARRRNADLLRNEMMTAHWTTPSFLEAVTSGKVGTHAITEAASR